MTSILTKPWPLCPSIPNTVVKDSLAVVALERIQKGNLVKVTTGELIGMVGVIESIGENGATVWASPTDLQLVPIDVLRKHFQVGDQVIVDFGIKAGVTAWVISMDDMIETLCLYSHETAHKIQVPLSCVSFPSSSLIASVGLLPNVLGDDPNWRLVGLPSDPNEQESSRTLPKRLSYHRRVQLGDDPNQRLVGRHIRIIGKTKFKNYEGIIKSSEPNDILLVELQAMMKRQRIHISNLTHWYDNKMKSLGPTPHLQDKGKSKITAPIWKTGASI
ncbi:hypothetical protein DXG01_000596 [Tephrocybe rancida]|nr:hypothetical protein DXG01_000596 [Tephrocybe rancida]